MRSAACLVPVSLFVKPFESGTSQLWLLYCCHRGPGEDVPRAGGGWQSPAGFMPSKHQRKRSFRCSNILETLRKTLWDDWEDLSALAGTDS